MSLDLAAFKDLSPNVIATLIGAGVTLIAALINLRIAWRREILAKLPTRRGGKPKRGLLPAIGFLVVAAAIGGYSLALYVMHQRENDVALLRAELRQRAQEMKLAAERIERARVREGRELALKP